MFVPKKNKKLQVCINQKKFNAIPIRVNHLSITKHVLERVARKQPYSFLDGFLGYNQVSRALHDQHKIKFAMEWGVFSFKFMPFGLNNAPTTFQRLICHAFKYLRVLWNFTPIEPICTLTSRCLPSPYVPAFGWKKCGKLR